MSKTTRAVSAKEETGGAKTLAPIDFKHPIILEQKNGHLTLKAPNIGATVTLPLPGFKEAAEVDGKEFNEYAKTLLKKLLELEAKSKNKALIMEKNRKEKAKKEVLKAHMEADYSSAIKPKTKKEALLAQRRRLQNMEQNLKYHTQELRKYSRLKRLKVKDVCKVLGLSRNAIIRRCNAGELKCHPTKGGTREFILSEVMDYLERRAEG